MKLQPITPSRTRRGGGEVRLDDVGFQIRTQFYFIFQRHTILWSIGTSHNMAIANNINQSETNFNYRFTSSNDKIR